MYNDTLPFIQRVAYSQAILLSTTIPAYGYLMARTWGRVDWAHKFQYSTFRLAYTMPPVIDQDNWDWNYVVHPVMGYINYMSWRNRGGSILSSFAASAFNSAEHEYLIAASMQRPSLNDMIVTPVLGSLLGEGCYQWRHHLMKDKQPALYKQVLIFVLDPIEDTRVRLAAWRK